MRALPYCPRCGSPLDYGDNFCSKCGRRLDPKYKPEEGVERSIPLESHEPVQITTMSMTLEAIKSLFRPTPVQQMPSEAIYAKRPHSPMKRQLILATVFIALGLTISYGRAWLSYLGLTLSGFAAPVLLLIWMARNDRFEHEPFSLIALTFGWGVFCGIFAAIFNQLVMFPLFGPPGAAFVEEPLKIVGVFWLARHSRLRAEFNDHLDGMVYGAAAGAGFAGMENLYYLLQMIFKGGLLPLIAISIRSATSICHIAWSAMAGRSIGLTKALRGHTRSADLIPGLVLAVPMHFIWNFLSPALDLFLLLPLFIFILSRQVKVAQRDEARWGYSASAPLE